MAKDNAMIFQNLAAIQEKVDVIAKGRKNTSQGYNFRGVEDVLNVMHGLLTEQRVIVVTRKVGTGLVEERPTKSGGIQIYRINDYEFDFVAVDGSKVTVGPIPGEGADSGDKASNKTLANSYKYCMFMTFSIPTAGLVVEPDDDSPEDSAAKTEKPPSQNGGKNGGTYQELRKQLDDMLAQDGFDEKEVKQAKAMASKIKPTDTSSLTNLIRAWEKKKSSNVTQPSPAPAASAPNDPAPATEPKADILTPEQMAEFVQGDLVEDPAASDDFEDDIPF